MKHALGMLISCAFALLLVYTTPALGVSGNVNPGRRALGWLAFLLFAAIMIPVPHALYSSFGIHRPYL